MSAHPITPETGAVPTPLADTEAPPTVYCEVDDRPLEAVPTPEYTDEEHGTWALLLERQRKMVPTRACGEYLRGLERMPFGDGTRIPALHDVSASIERHTGWRLHRVDGLVHPKQFFELLADRRFPSTDFIRKREELDYTPSPDMFHDLFGHSPLLTDPEFTEFFYDFGQAGLAAFRKFPEGHPIQEAIARMYWFTVEFGLIDSGNNLRAYGAGSISSPEEISHCLSDNCTRLPFDPSVVAQHDYDIWHLQDVVYVISGFGSLGTLFRDWARDENLLP